MTKLFIILSLFISQLCFANMASPIRNGTFSSSAFSSLDINIRKEKISLNIDKDLKTATFVIQYFIKTDVAGKQIPLLFYAKDYKGDFKISVDDIATKLLDIPSQYQNTYSTPFQSFSNSFSTETNENTPQKVTIFWNKNYGNIYELKDLKYFETNLTKGDHIIRVEYVANAWSDVSDWVKEYSFRYSLSPAKYWKSFGTLEITINAPKAEIPIKTDLGEPTSGKIDSVAYWKFDKLPADFFTVSYKPKISSFAETLINIDPFGFCIIVAFMLTIIHLISIKKYRKSNPTKNHSFVVILGSFVIPLLVLISYILFYNFIDYAIGIEAGKNHGYTFLVIFLYPILFPIYWLILWLIDKKIKAKQIIH